MGKISGYKAVVMIAGAMIFTGTGAFAAMQCAPGKCGASMKMEMKKSGPMSEESPAKCGEGMKEKMKGKMPCGCEKKKCDCEKKGQMKGKCADGKCAQGKCGEGKCGEGMKEKMKGEMKGKCAAGKCGGM